MWGHRLFILVSASNDLSSSDSSGSSGSDETDLLTSAGSPPDGGGLANVLMVTTTVGMLHGVHGNTTNLKQSDVNHSVIFSNFLTTDYC